MEEETEERVVPVDEPRKVVCKECNAWITNLNTVLARHMKTKHDLTWVDYLVKYEHSGVHPTCECGCGERIKWKKGGFSRFINGHQSRGEFNSMSGRKGEDNPNTGKMRTSEMKERYAEAARKRWSDPSDVRREIIQSEEYREKMSRSSKEAGSRPSTRQKRSKASKQWWQENPEMRKVWSDRAIRLLDEGKIGPQAPFKCEWVHNPFTDQQEYMHSSWETRFLQECVNREEPVTKKHDIRIPYVDPNGLDKVYIPDFIALDTSKLYEIKGLETDTDHCKYEAAVKWCYERGVEFVVVSFK